MLRICSGCGVRRRGLTLVEVLIVVGIIGLLVAILMPVVSRVRGNARLVQCISNLRQFDMAFKGRDVTRPDTRLPQAEMWMSVVAASADGAGKTLQCPDGARAGGGRVDGSSAIFHTWRGNATGNPNGSRFTGEPLWRETRSDPAADGSYTISYRTKPGGPSLVIAYKPLGGDKWRATVTSHPGAPYRIDAFITSDGRRFTHVKQGFSVEYTSVAGGIDYGFNSLASGLGDYKAGKVIVMDFNKPVFDFDGWQDATTPDDYLPARVLGRRHLKKVNALLSDGSVQSFALSAVAPADSIYAIASRRGPNPGVPEPQGDGGGKKK